MADLSPLQRRLHDVIFEADSPAGKLFDIVLLCLIAGSISVVMLESVPTLRDSHGQLFISLEWVCTGLFTLEYLLRLYCVRRTWGYAKSFYGLVDLLSILPTWLTLFGFGAQSMVVIRGLRLLRIFRVFKLVRFVREMRVLRVAMRSSTPKLVVFLVAFTIAVLIIGTGMYLVEAEQNRGLSNIPDAVYWAIVTVTGVGYGDTVPGTPTGKALAALLMVLGFALVIISAGVVSAELIQAGQREMTTQACPECMTEGHEPDAKHCKHCGAQL